MTKTHSFAEWAACLSLGVSGIAVVALGLAFADADPTDFDPRRPIARLVEAGHLDPLLIVVGPAWVAARDAALDLAALIVLLTTSPKGAMA